MRPRSPIEMLVDRICGVPPEAFKGPVDPVTLVCTECAATHVVEREPDFFDFDTIETLCPKCRGTDQSSEEQKP